jgi:hypothetical protein
MKTNLLKTYHYIFHKQGLLSRLLIVLAVAVSITYGTLLVSTIKNIRERKEIRTEIKNTQTRISELETQYFQLAANINSSYVASLGFYEDTQPVFAYTHDTHASDAFAMNTPVRRLK